MRLMELHDSAGSMLTTSASRLSAPQRQASPQPLGSVILPGSICGRVLGLILLLSGRSLHC